VKKLAILKVQWVILTVFTFVIFFLLRFHLKSGDASGQDNEGKFVGLERPLWSFGHKHLAKSGVAPAQHGVLPESKLIVAVYASSTPLGTCSIATVNVWVNDRVICVLHAPVTLPRPKKRLRFVAIDTHLLLKRPRKRENAKGSFGHELQEPVGSVLMVESPPSPLYLLGNIEKGKR
jgi:hypothetical protein